MRKFTFRLEAVRRIREQEEQLVQIELAQVLRERNSAADELAASRDAGERVHEYLRSSQLSGAEMLHVSRYDTLHRQRIVDLTIALHHRDQAVERVRLRLIEARAAREALDKLEQRQRDAHRKAWLAQEGRELDEIGSQRRHKFGAALIGALDGEGARA